MKKKIIFELVLPIIVAALVLGAGFSQTVRAESQDVNSVADACVRSNPTVLITPLAVRVLNPANANVSYYVTIKNNDTAACEDSIFELSSVAPAGWQSSLDLSSISIAPRSMARAKMTVIAPQTAKPGNYLFAVSAVNSFDSSYQASVTATLYGPPTHIFSLSPKVVNSNEVNISDAGDLRWKGLVLLSGEQSKEMVRQDVGLLVSITGADKKIRGFNMRPQGELVKVTEAEENDLGVATQLDVAAQSGLTGPEYIADGGRSSAYVLMGRKWIQSDPQIKMSLKDDALLAATGMAKSNVLGAITAATNTWDDATNQNLFSDSGASLTTTENWKYDGVNNMAFKPYAAGCSALAATGVWYKAKDIASGFYPIVESDISFNSNLKWTTTGESGKLDFQSVALHELGHTIGLGDLYNKTEFTNDIRQVMHYYIGVKRTLGNGDRTGVWKIYDGSVSTDTSMPSVSLTAPVANSTYASAQTVAINATATDNTGVTKVDFYDGATLLATDTASPYSYSWAITSANNGSHSLTAKAYDATGNSAVSAAVAVTVNIVSVDIASPTVSITSPSNGTSYSSAQTIAINAAATDNTSVTKVEFYDGTTLLGSDTSSPYSYSWAITSANNGSHSLTAKAYDAAGNSKVSGAIAVTVNIAITDTVAPTISLTAPSNGTSYSSAQTIAVNAAATDNTSVTKVEFYDGTTLLGSDTSSPYSYSWAITSANNGSHSLTAKAYDAAGNSKVSGAIAVTVNITSGDTTKPTVSITAPTANSIISATTNITAAATDNVSVAKVEFYIDGVLSAVDTTSPYNYSWNTLVSANGSHSLTAKAYDSAGNVGTSAAVNVTVSNTVVSTAPTVSIIAPANGSSVSGTVAISVTTANKSLTSQYTSLYIDGKYVSSAVPRYSSFQYSWNTTGYANGQHTIKATIGTAASTTITVTVNNVAVTSQESLESLALMIQSIQASLAGIMAQMGK